VTAGLFSAVATTFIVAMQSTLGPNPTDTTNALLMMLTHTIDNSTLSDQTLGLPTQTLAYASLAVSLLAALGAALKGQWLSHFNRFGRGTLDDRGCRRQQKRNGPKRWQFEVVTEALPALLQITRLLFGIALSANVWLQDQIVASVIVGTTAFGALCYLIITIALFSAPYCSFQTP
ncbi:hypothetical protein BDN67DRAFT_864476, partial [Paxillus ammoniavirescens]